MAKTLSWNEAIKAYQESKIIQEPFQISNKFEPVVTKLFDQIMDDTAAEYLNFVKSCESPIERLLGLALCKSEKTFCSISDTGQYNISTQEKINCGDVSYRVDFLLSACYLEKIYRVVIECDGHEFHQKTKQQVEKDNERDRNLLKFGYLVARFSGSEIMKDPHRCAREANYMIFHNEG